MLNILLKISEYLDTILPGVQGVALHWPSVSLILDLLSSLITFLSESSTSKKKYALFFFFFLVEDPSTWIKLFKHILRLGSTNFDFVKSRVISHSLSWMVNYSTVKRNLVLEEVKRLSTLSLGLHWCLCPVGDTPSFSMQLRQVRAEEESNSLCRQWRGMCGKPSSAHLPSWAPPPLTAWPNHSQFLFKHSVVIWWVGLVKRGMNFSLAIWTNSVAHVLRDIYLLRKTSSDT